MIEKSIASNWNLWINETVPCMNMLKAELYPSPGLLKSHQSGYWMWEMTEWSVFCSLSARGFPLLTLTTSFNQAHCQVHHIPLQTTTQTMPHSASHCTWTPHQATLQFQLNTKNFIPTSHWQEGDILMEQVLFSWTHLAAGSSLGQAHTELLSCLWGTAESKDLAPCPRKAEKL